MIRPESRIRNRAVASAGLLTLFAALLGQGALAWLLVSVTAALVMWASAYRGAKLFTTSRPDLFPIGSEWRMHRITAVDRWDDDLWVVRGTPIR